MTMTARGTASATAAVLLTALAACGGGEDGPRGVLTEDDVANVRVVTDTGRGLGVPLCRALGPAELSIRQDNGAADHHRRFRLDDGDVVGSAVNGISRRFDTAADALDVIDTALDDCTSSPSPSGVSVARLSGLDEGQHGYRQTVETSTSRRVLDRVLAPHGDHVVTVSVLHTGRGEPSVDVRDLLPTALTRADELD